MVAISRHTRGAPAGIQTGTPPQQQWQKLFIPAYELYCEAPNGTNPPTIGRTGVVQYWSFDPAALNECFGKVKTPTDWIAGTDAYIYPVFSMNQDWLGKVRWGIQYVAQVRNISIASVGTTMESSIDADGTGLVIPPKAQWLTLSAALLAESIYKMDDFTTLSHLEFRWYRDGLSVLDNHGGHARLYGLVVMYQAYI